MITVSFARDKPNGIISMAVKGHAGQDNKGHDLVCASASILAYTVAQTLEYIAAQGGFDGEAQLKLNDGDALISCKPKEKYLAETLNTFFVAEVGYSLLARNYPQFVKLKMFGNAE